MTVNPRDAARIFGSESYQTAVEQGMLQNSNGQTLQDAFKICICKLIKKFSMSLYYIADIKYVNVHGTNVPKDL